MSGSETRVAGVVLHFGNPDETRIAVSRVLASRRPVDELVVVDNDPSRRCAAALSDLDDRIVLVESAHNAGFSAGMNAGIREALGREADRILVLNNDVVVPPDAIGFLERALDANPDAGAVGPVILARRDPGTVESMGMSFDPTTGRMRHPECGRRVSEVLGAGCTVRAVDGLSGCAMLVTRRAIEAVGPFDESYFFSFEDLDWCLRARRAGFASLIVPDARVYHQGSASMGESTDRLYYAARNHLKLAKSLNGRHGVGAFRATSIIGLNLAHAVRAKGGTLPSRLRSVVKGVRDAGAR